MQVNVVAATANQQSVLANLLELYAHDFSEISELQLNPDGRFGYEPLPLYWQEPQRHPLLVWVDGYLSGFVLVKQGSELSGDAKVWDMAEFFIVRGYRRHGVGLQVAHAVWRKFPGRWEVRVTEKNRAGQAFWRRAVAAFMGEPVEAVVSEIKQKLWHVFSFDTAGAKAN